MLDERFTSVMANDAMIAAGSTKKQRRDKGTVDMISAVLLLQNYLEKKKFNFL
jgi:putative Holliday junction resolvase